MYVFAPARITLEPQQFEYDSGGGPVRANIVALAPRAETRIVMANTMRARAVAPRPQVKIIADLRLPAVVAGFITPARINVRAVAFGFTAGQILAAKITATAPLPQTKIRAGYPVKADIVGIAPRAETHAFVHVPQAARITAMAPRPYMDAFVFIPPFFVNSVAMAPRAETRALVYVPVFANVRGMARRARTSASVMVSTTANISALAPRAEAKILAELGDAPTPSRRRRGSTTII